MSLLPMNNYGGGLLSNPLFQMGLGILGNNQGNYGSTGAALGRGAMQGLQNVQESQRMKQQGDLYALQMKKYEKDAEESGRKSKALSGFDEKFPQYAGLADLNPTAALKIAYPDLASSSADPYFSPVPTEQGMAYFDHRTGTMKLINGENGAPVVKSTDSPTIRGAVKGAEAEAQANWKPNNDVDGLLSTDANIVRQINGGMPTNNFSTPYPVTMGAPGTTATDRAEGTTTDALGVGNPAQPKFTMGGMRVPTAGELEQQKANIQANKELRVAGEKVGIESAAKKDATMAGVGGAIDQARSILTGKRKPTGSLLGNAADAAGAVVGYSPPGAAEADALKTVAGQLVSKMPRMEGPQSNYDVQNYKEMAGDVGNPNIPTERRLRALEEMEKIVRRYDKTGKAAAPKVYNALPKKAPKGQIVKNPDTGERRQFDGMRWKPL
jgi:hypothetical protein